MALESKIKIVWVKQTADVLFDFCITHGYGARVHSMGVIPFRMEIECPQHNFKAKIKSFKRER